MTETHTPGTKLRRHPRVQRGGRLSYGLDLVLRQLRAGLFATLFLSAMIVTGLIWQPDWPLHRYDALFLLAICLQALFLWRGLETPEEARVILLFHLTGTAMEWFKVSAGSWSYPEPGLFKILSVPLFSGFMYGAVGSYILRAIRSFELWFSPFPPIWMGWLLAIAIYVNFFAHHILLDIRLALFAATLLMFWRSRIWVAGPRGPVGIPFPLVMLAGGILLWVAENIGTFSGTWIYSGQSPDQFVSMAKIGSWYLLLYVAFFTVMLVNHDAIRSSPPRRHR